MSLDASPEYDVRVEAAAGPQATGQTAVIDLGNLLIGLPAENLREVVHFATDFAAIASSAVGVVGALPLRGQVVPVVDLSVVCGLGASPVTADERVVLVVRAKGRIIGVLARQALRIVAEESLEAHGVYAGEGLANVLFPTVGMFEETTVSLLDPEALIDAGLPVIDDARAAKRVWDTSGQYLLFAIDDTTFALPIVEIQTTLPDSPVYDWSTGSQICEGAVRWQGDEMPLVSLRAALGLPARPLAGQTAQAVVIGAGEGQRVAIRCDAVKDIIAISDKSIMPASTTLYPDGTAIKGLVALPDDAHIVVLDPENLRAHHGVGRMAALCHKIGTAAAEARQEVLSANPGLCLIFVRGRHLAIPLANVIDILPVASGIAAAAEAGETGWVTNLSHRGTVVPVYVCSGNPLPYGEKAAVVVMQSDGDKLATLVNELVAVDTLAYYQRSASAISQLAKRVGDKDSTQQYRVCTPRDLTGSC